MNRKRARGCGATARAAACSAAGLQEMKLWRCRRHGMVALAGQTRGGCCSKQGSRLKRRRDDASRARAEGRRGDAGSGLVRRGAQTMAGQKGACTQHARWDEAGKRV